MRLLVAVGLTLIPAFAVSAQAPSAEKAESPKIICKADPQDTDSRVRRRICKTEAEWNGVSAKKSEADEAPKQSQ